ncbi:hypothetical protein BRADI_4g02966v3 [Brachypodium distachyon]|uniref:DUF7597 domain-containing protein n=1 Tax=Brachypodium distachyon TaxID=15368 RepID=A0A0Q3GYS0_BRADI|nr:hypothetical protein BRADI_4g02966v3 [Brachypodium distachyon]
MAKYPVDPTPHLPPGTSVVAPNPHRPQRGYVVLSGGVPIICDEWAIATLAPPVENEEYGDALEIIRHFLTNRRLPVRFTSRCGMGTALIQFMTVCDRDTAVNSGPYYIDDRVLRFVPQNRGINHREAVFTHDVWIMLLNYPLECWDIEAVTDAFVPYGSFLVWNKELSNRARILVKIRVYDILALTLSLVILSNSNDMGHGDSWTCPLFVLSYDLLGALTAEEDPLPPGGETPHPMPIQFNDVWPEPSHVPP